MNQSLLFTLFPFFPNTHSETLAYFGDDITKSILFESLILYNKVYIPTQGLSELLILGHWLGYDTLEELLRQKCVNFIQQEGRVVYSGETKELITIILERPVNENEQVRYFAKASKYSPPEAAEIILKYGTMDLTESSRRRIVRLIENCSFKLPVSNLNGVVDDTLKDLKNNSGLKKLLNLTFRKVSKLKGIGKNQFQVGIGNDISYQNSEISNLLKLAFLNCLIMWGIKSDSNIFHIQKVYRDIAYTKGDFVEKSKNISSGIDELLIVKQIPNLRAMAIDQTIDSMKLLDIITSDYISDFRVWLHSLDANNPTIIPKSYIELLENNIHSTNLATRIIKYVFSAFVSKICPPAGCALSLIDLFFGGINKGDIAAKFFFEDLSHLNQDRE